MKNTHPEKHKPFRRFWGLVCVVAQHRLTLFARQLVHGDSFEVENLVQDTIYRVLRYPKNPQHISNILGFLFRVMRNRWIDTVKKRSRLVTVSLDDPVDGKALARRLPPVPPEALRNLENQELWSVFQANQRSLTPREKRVITLYICGYGCEEIAAVLGVSVGTIKVELNRVRTKVAARLKNRS